MPISPYYQDDAVTLYHGDCREVLPQIAPASIDLVFTDPPYLAPFIPLYGDIARWSAVVLKPERFVYTYIGAEFLVDVIQLMAPHLTWFWSFNLRHGGANPRMWNKRLMVTSKPVLAWTNGPVSQLLLRWCAVDHGGDTKSKEFHKWGQSEGFALKHIALRTEAGDTVIDPCAGGGTTLAAAKRLGRKAIGCETDEGNCKIIADRLAQGALNLFGEHTA